jgi:hypothetical protein
MWSYDWSGPGWTMLTPPSAPSERAEALGVFDSARRQFLVHGGRFYRSPLSHGLGDTWIYDVASNTWSSPSVGEFGNRWGEIGIYDPVRDRVVAFGGTDTLSHDFTDVHVLTLGSGGSWSTLATAGTPPSIVPFPSFNYSRATFNAMYDPSGDRMLLTVGNGSTMELWQLTLDATPTWSQIVPDGGAPSHRYHATATFDASLGRVLLVGGGQNIDAGGSNETWELFLDEATPTAVSLVSADATPDRVRLVWQSPDRNLSVTVQRRATGEDWLARGEGSPDGAGHMTFEDREVVSGAQYDYRLRIVEPGGERFYGETSIRIPLRSGLSLQRMSPNPSGGDPLVSFALGSSQPAALELFDVLGRRVLTREVGSLGAGAHIVRLMGTGSILPAGRYVLRLSQSGAMRSVSVVLTH